MRIGLVLAMLMLAGCVMGGQEPKPGTSAAPSANPILGEAIATTSLDAAPAAATPPKVQPTDEAPPTDEAAEAKPKPTEEATAAEPPPVPQSPAEAKCLKSGGVWASAGKTGAQACVQRTRDAGKQCTKQTQCEGFCLARSGTCAPITPMFGCNDILQADGRMVTLCLD